MPSAVRRVPSSGSTATSTSGPKPAPTLLAVEQHRRLVFLPLADHDDALHRDRVDHPRMSRRRRRRRRSCRRGRSSARPPSPPPRSPGRARGRGCGRGRWGRAGAHGSAVDPTARTGLADARLGRLESDHGEPREQHEHATERSPAGRATRRGAIHGEEDGRDGLEEGQDARRLGRRVAQERRRRRASRAPSARSPSRSTAAHSPASAGRRSGEQAPVRSRSRRRGSPRTRR